MQGGLIDTILETSDLNQKPVTLFYSRRQLGRRRRRRRHSQRESPATVPLPVPGCASLSMPPSDPSYHMSIKKEALFTVQVSLLFLIPHVKN